MTRVLESRTGLDKAKNGGADIVLYSEVDIIKIEAIGGQRLSKKWAGKRDKSNNYGV